MINIKVGMDKIIIVAVGVIILINFFSFGWLQEIVYETATVNCGGMEKIQWVSFEPFTGGFGFGCMPK